VIDGDIIVIGGGFDENEGNNINEVWKSEDKGESWKQMQDAPFYPCWTYSVSVIDGSIIVISFKTDHVTTFSNEVWKSEDKGESWKQMQDATFSPRLYYTSSVID